MYFSPGRYRARQQARARTQEIQKIPEAPKENVNKGPVYNCPLSKQDFRGPCPIMQCNFNITKYKPTESCCLVIQTGGKEHFDKWDLQNTLGIAESKLYKLKDQGNNKANCILLLNRILERVREHSTVNIKVENTSRISNFISNSHLSLKELKVKITDVILLRRNLPEIEEFLRQSGHDYTLAEILGTDKPIP